MNGRTVRRAGAIAGVGLLAWIGWGTYVNRSAEQVPYEAIKDIGGVELRRYPETMAVATTGSDDEAAFERLFEYISGTNHGTEDLSMTTPVRTEAASNGEAISMTAPVRTDRAKHGVRMEFYLPAEYTAANAPRPTDPRVDLLIRPPRTIAVRPFSGYAWRWRTNRRESELLDVLDGEGIEAVDEPTLLRYDAPSTPPFMRHNEVSVEIAGTD
jgi:hypothetical protein